MIVLFTDFGQTGPYIGQLRATLLQHAPTVPVVNLFADAPTFNARASAYLLAAYREEFPSGSVFLCVVDPGVGSSRRPVVVQADGRWFVGPDNGLFNVIAGRDANSRAWEITLQPRRLSASFHGRDLFAPVAAQLALGKQPQMRPVANLDDTHCDWPDDLRQIVYIDHYGNAITGTRASTLDPRMPLAIKQKVIRYRHVFSQARQNEIFWYKNANGLVEIAVNRGSAATALGLEVGDRFSLVT
ncbi:MAG: SAM hydrolase/SAM-dependent halogenase family protein [Gammaproteobacteria bacterium]